MDTDMNDLASPSQSSPSMSGNTGQNKGSSMSENSTVVSFAQSFFVYISFIFDFSLPASYQTPTSRTCKRGGSERTVRRGSRGLPAANR